MQVGGFAREVGALQGIGGLAWESRTRAADPGQNHHQLCASGLSLKLFCTLISNLKMGIFMHDPYYIPHGKD